MNTMSDASLDNLNELVYVDLSNTTSQKCPINTVSTPCIICQEKCTLSFSNAYFQATCNTFAGGLVYSNMTTTATSYLTFNENTFNVTSLYLLVPSINTYIKSTYSFVTHKWSSSQTAELVIQAMSDYGYLIIYIPIVIGTSTTIPIPEDLTETQSLTNINLYNYLPSERPYYFFTAPYKSSTANYIIFPSTSCNVTITSEDYKRVLDVNPTTGSNLIKNPGNNYFKLYGTSIYYNEVGANFSDSNDYYLDCQVADYEEMDETPVKVKEEQTASDPQNSQNMYSALIFIVVSVVCILLYVLIIYMPTLIS